jgi:hypothetical protein
MSTVWRVLFCLFFAHSLAAQKVTFSEDIPLRSDASYQIIGQLKGRLLLFRDRTTSFEVQGFNERMKEIWSKEIDLDKRLPVVLSLSTGREDFCVFYRFRQRSHTILKAHKYDAGANLLDSTTVKNLGYVFFTPDFRVIYSENKRKALIYHMEKESILHALVFDIDNMRLMWDNIFQPEDFDAARDITHIRIDNEGNFFFIIEKNNVRYKKEPHYFEVHQYLVDGGGYHRHIISLESKLTYDVGFSFDNLNKYLVAGGMYSDNNPSRAAGYFFLRAPRAALQQYQLSFHAFDDEFVSNLMGKESEVGKGIMECSVQDIVLRRDGGILIVCERNRQFERRMAATNRVIYDTYNRFVVDHFYDDLFVIAVHPDGSPHWRQVLHKKQYSQDDDGAFSSYFMVKTPERLRFLFNDEIRFENTVSEYHIDGRGEFKRHSVLSTENLKLRLRFRSAIQTSGRQVVIPSERRNQLRLVKIDY